MFEGFEAVDIGGGDAGREVILDLMVGVLFADRRLAEVCDARHRDRSDLDRYLSKIAER